jgi:hypothetical protein
MQMKHILVTRFSYIAAFSAHLIISILTLIFTVTVATEIFAASTQREATTKKQALPAGFIALAPQKMNWRDANAYCASKGGKLPLINNAASLGSTDGFDYFIDGFGERGSDWPDGLAYDGYWTGTTVTEDPGWVRVVYDDQPGPEYYRNVHVNTGVQAKNVKDHVVCVP